MESKLHPTKKRKTANLEVRNKRLEIRDKKLEIRD
jgi:hypothetical protein